MAARSSTSPRSRASSAGIGLSTYRAAKAGVIHFSRSAAVELAELDVRVNVIAPGNIATDINAAFDTEAIVRRIQPLQRLGTTTDVANAAVYLASDRSAQVTGLVLPVDGGTTVGPRPTSLGNVMASHPDDRERSERKRTHARSNRDRPPRQAASSTSTPAR